MTAASATPTACPSCGSAFVLGLDTGNMFCAECRHEWDPKAPPAPKPAAKAPASVEKFGQALEAQAARTAGRQVGEPLADEQDLIDRVDELGNYITTMHVLHDDGGSGNWRTDLFSWCTKVPHEYDEALYNARDHFENEVGSSVASIGIVARSPEDLPPTVTDIDNDTAAELETLIADTDADAEQYLESLVGTAVTLEGGQRAVILAFDDTDGDRIIVQLADGSTVSVEFNDVLRADNGPAEIVEAEIDDSTAQAFGTGSLLFACMVIEAGIASIEGDGDEAHLVESPTGWFITDEDAVPLMEQASAAAVAMLIQTFALPRAALVEMVETVRNDALAATATEDTGHDTNTSDDE